MCLIKIIGLSLLLLFTPVLLNAAQFKLGIEIAENFINQTSFFDQYEYRFDYDESVNLLRVSPKLSVNAENGVYGYLGGDFTWGHYFQGDEARSVVRGEDNSNNLEFDLSMAYVGFKFARFNAQLGHQPMGYGQHYIFADDTLGALISYEYQKINLNISAAKVFDSSPMVGITAGYRPGLFENIDVFAIWYDDRDDAFKKTLNPILSERFIESKGHLTWFGATASKFLGDFYFTFSGAVEKGQVTFLHSLGKIERDVSAYFIDTGIETNLSDHFSMGLFCFISSGDSELHQGDLSVFISPLPYNPHASIFFDPNFMDRSETSSLVLGGVTRFGVISPGVHVSAEPMDNLFIETKVVTLYAQDTPSDIETWYGWEVDLDIEYVFKKKYTIYMEAARFEHGDYFEQVLGEQPDAAFRFVIGGQMDFSVK